MKTWIFQANPAAFDIDGYLNATAEINWTVRQRHLQSRMAVGDRVFIWRAGGDRPRDAGIVAEARITSEPAEEDEDADSVAHWAANELVRRELRVQMRVERVATAKEVVRRDWLKNDPILSDLRILRFASETNYLVEERHAWRLASLWENTGENWDWDDCVAGLWAYDRTYAGIISTMPGSLVSDVALTIGRAVQGVYNKVMNFRALDPRDGRSGFTGGGETTKQVWDAFYDAQNQRLRSDLLDLEYRITWQNLSQRSIRETIQTFEMTPAVDDDPTHRVSMLRRVRKGQPQFRTNLLASYGDRCAITDEGPAHVLEAAHIHVHHQSGLNSVDNGVLLRSDLHILFDLGYLRIDPETLTVCLSDDLRDTSYWHFHGTPLRKRVDGGYPRKDLLALRWTGDLGTSEELLEREAS